MSQQRPLRVLHVNTTDLDGGAARAAHRIHTAQRRIGVDSHMLVLRRRDADPYVHQPQVRADQVALQRLRMGLGGQIAARQKTSGNPSQRSVAWLSSGLGRWINDSDFDLVNLHWVGEEMLSVTEIGALRKPICWTMHDMWPFTGAEHYDDLNHPGRYLTDYATSTRAPGDRGPDLDAWTWRRKRRAWRAQRFALISPSHWLAGCAASSSLMGGQPIHVIENCIDTQRFRPIERGVARAILGVDPRRRYILFGAVSSTSDSRKGFHLLQPALRTVAQRLGAEAGVELLVFGSGQPGNPPDFGMPVHYLGSFHDEVTLSLLYSAADVFVAPSMQDNLPNTLVESLACGTPCVGFRIGGLPDLVHTPQAGWLADPFDVEDLAEAVMKVLQTPVGADRGSLLDAGLCDPDTVARRYLALYESVCDVHRPA
jgi:glycosyltransferase involved in cell wall biosynthesis